MLPCLTRITAPSRESCYKRSRQIPPHPPVLPCEPFLSRPQWPILMPQAQGLPQSLVQLLAHPWATLHSGTTRGGLSVLNVPVVSLPEVSSCVRPTVGTWELLRTRAGRIELNSEFLLKPHDLFLKAEKKENSFQTGQSCVFVCQLLRRLRREGRLRPASQHSETQLHDGVGIKLKALHHRPSPGGTAKTGRKVPLCTAMCLSPL